MSENDRRRWDDSYRERRPPSGPALPSVFTRYEPLFPSSGTALELACGTGAAAVWLAQRGLDVHGVDVSEVAVGQARALAENAGVTARCRFDTWDLDAGMPDGDPVDLLLCHRYYDPRWHDAYIARLAPGGLLAICVLSEVGSAPGRFRAVAGELDAAFAELDQVAAGEGDGQAWLVARRARP